MIRLNLFLYAPRREGRARSNRGSIPGDAAGWGSKRVSPRCARAAKRRARPAPAEHARRTRATRGRPGRRGRAAALAVDPRALEGSARPHGRARAASPQGASLSRAGPRLEARRDGYFGRPRRGADTARPRRAHAGGEGASPQPRRT